MVGCAETVDVTIRNPLMARGVDHNSVIRVHEYDEHRNGLPDGAMDDVAKLVAMDHQKICFAITLHELDPIDIRLSKFKLTAPYAGPNEKVELTAEPPTIASYQGLVPHQRETGAVENRCTQRADNDDCVHWEKKPAVETIYQPGEVVVYQTSGQACFKNEGWADTHTDAISLELKTHRPSADESDSLVRVGNNKQAVFKWAFSDTGVSKGAQ